MLTIEYKIEKLEYNKSKCKNKKHKEKSKIREKE